MMPVVRINDATFGDLRTIADWLGTKTPSETIDRIVREAMDRLDLERDEQPESTSSARSNGAIKFETAPSLAFTKPLSASVNGKAIQNPRWSTLLLATIAHVKSKGVEGERLVRELGVGAKAKQYEEEGFSYHPDLGISVQGQSAPEAWKEVDRLAKKWRIPVTVEFSWRANPKAQYPGQRGVLITGNG